MYFSVEITGVFFQSCKSFFCAAEPVGKRRRIAAFECRQFRRLSKDLTDLKKADQPIAELHRYSRLSQTERTLDSAWLRTLVFGEAFLRLQTESAGTFAIGEKSAERIFVFVAVERKRERFPRAQRQGQSRGFAEYFLVVTKNLGGTQSIDQFPIIFPNYFKLERGVVLHA